MTEISLAAYVHREALRPFEELEPRCRTRPRSMIRRLTFPACRRRGGEVDEETGMSRW